MGKLGEYPVVLEYFQVRADYDIGQPGGVLPKVVGHVHWISQAEILHAQFDFLVMKRFPAFPKVVQLLPVQYTDIVPV
jgi:hypothetical protein